MKKTYKTWPLSKKEAFVSLAKQHQKADRFIQGSWLHKGDAKDKQGMYKGCFFGCMMQASGEHSMNLASYKMSLPKWIISAAENIFEVLPASESIKFPVKLLESIPVNVDSKKIIKRFVYILLTDNKHGYIKNTMLSSEEKELAEELALMFSTKISTSRADEIYLMTVECPIEEAAYLASKLTANIKIILSAEALSNLLSELKYTYIGENDDFAKFAAKTLIKVIKEVK